MVSLSGEAVTATLSSPVPALLVCCLALIEEHCTALVPARCVRHITVCCFVGMAVYWNTHSALLTHLPTVAEDALDALLACHFVLFEEISLFIASLST